MTTGNLAYPKVKAFYIERARELLPEIQGRDLFEPRPGMKGWRGLVQRLCFRILRRLNCKAAPFYVATVKRTPIADDGGEIAGKIARMIRSNFTEMIWLGAAKTLLMGPDTFNQLMDETAGYDSWFALNFETKVSSKTGDGTATRFMGLDVHVIPSMEGFVILPGRISADGRYTDEDEIVHLREGVYRDWLDAGQPRIKINGNPL